MSTTNRQSGTHIHEISDGAYRINLPAQIPGAGGFSLNQHLILDEAPLLFHAGLRGMLPLVREAVPRFIPVEKLRYIAFSHVEVDECAARHGPGIGPGYVNKAIATAGGTV